MGGSIYTNMFIKYFKHFSLYMLLINDKVCNCNFLVINICHVWFFFTSSFI